MFYVTRYDKTRLYITDSKDNVEECWSYYGVISLINSGVVILGIELNSTHDNIASIVKYKKNNLYIFAIENNRYDIINSFCSDLNSMELKDLSIQSNKKVYWKCDVCNGIWSATPNLRFKKDRNRGCPYCSGKKVLVGFNDIETTNPYLIDEWDFDKNTIKPTEVTAGSNLDVFWLCNVCGCSYNSVIATKSRSYRRGLGCPDCASRRNELGYSLNERYVFNFLSNYYKCSDRVHFNHFEFDIIVRGLNILIEYDGNYWHEQENKIKRDILKNKLAKELGYTLIRIRESNLKPLDYYSCKNIMMKDFDNDINLVCNYLLDIINSLQVME